jgi:Tfp pilus assembly protein PilO
MFKPKFDIQRKHLFIALAILLSLAVIYRFFPFFQELACPEQKIALKESTLIKYQKEVAAGSNIDKRLASLNTGLHGLEAGVFLSGKTPPLAAVEIQRIVQEIADKSQLKINSVKVLNPVELDRKEYLSIPVEFDVVPTMRQLKELLYRIESSPKCLTLKKLTTRYYANKEGRFRCHMTIAGYMKRGEM